jgi:integrase
MTRLRHVVTEYLALRRALGYALVREGWLLPQFAAFVERHSPYITTPLALEWATQGGNASPYWSARRLGFVRGFARHVSAVDPRCEVPSADLLPFRKSRMTSYLYKESDVIALMEACQNLRGPLGHATYATLIALLAVTGMRVGEAIGLDRSDFDAPQQCLIIHTPNSESHGKCRYTRRPWRHLRPTLAPATACCGDHSAPASSSPTRGDGSWSRTSG